MMTVEVSRIPRVGGSSVAVSGSSVSHSSISGSSFTGVRPAACRRPCAEQRGPPGGECGFSLEYDPLVAIEN